MNNMADSTGSRETGVSSPSRISRLGFGTSGLMGAALTTRGRLRLLDTALAHGITHFDTAPLYGMGMAEEVLGRFCRGRREHITITTKFGLPPRPVAPLLRPLLPVARVINRSRSRMKRRDATSVSYGGPLQLTPPGSEAAEHPESRLVIAATAEALRKHLHTSLRKLQCDYVDHYVLHDCGSADLTDAVIEALENLRQEGKIIRWGIATGRQSSRKILSTHSHFQGVVQIPDHLLQLDTNWFVNHARAPLFTHSALRQGLLGGSDVDPVLASLVREWADHTGRSPGDSCLRRELLLLGALNNNPNGCVIFSTIRSDRIRANAEVLQRWGAESGRVAELLNQAITSAGGGGNP
jgi:D-threo-aldose 1-dehydrogenase